MADSQGVSSEGLAALVVLVEEAAAHIAQVAPADVADEILVVLGRLGTLLGAHSVEFGAGNEPEAELIARWEGLVAAEGVAERFVAERGGTSQSPPVRVASVGRVGGRRPWRASCGSSRVDWPRRSCGIAWARRSATSTSSLARC